MLLQKGRGEEKWEKPREEAHQTLGESRSGFTLCLGGVGSTSDLQIPEGRVADWLYSSPHLCRSQIHGRLTSTDSRLIAWQPGMPHWLAADVDACGGDSDRLQASTGSWLQPSS